MCWPLCVVGQRGDGEREKLGVRKKEREREHPPPVQLLRSMEGSVMKAIMLCDVIFLPLLLLLLATAGMDCPDLGVPPTTLLLGLCVRVDVGVCLD